MNFNFLTGLIGSITLLIGAGCPESSKIINPLKSVKNWLFAIGGSIMLLYAILGYLQGGSAFFVILEILIVIASVLMMLNIDDKIDVPVISTIGICLIIWSLYLFEDYSTIIFILGLCGVGLGYTFQMASLRRSVALTIGSILITIFSYIEMNWIFFYLNLFFAIFSTYYVFKAIKKQLS